MFEGDRILLVHEKNGTWALPGGWCDVDRAVGENAVKETLEEAGLTVTAERLIAVQDCKRHNDPASAYGIAKVFFLCRRVGGDFSPNLETTQSGYFALGELPENLATEKIPSSRSRCASGRRQTRPGRRSSTEGELTNTSIDKSAAGV